MEQTITGTSVLEVASQVTERAVFGWRAVSDIEDVVEGGRRIYKVTVRKG